jgi:hypothetical protein
MDQPQRCPFEFTVSNEVMVNTKSLAADEVQ